MVVSFNRLAGPLSVIVASRLLSSITMSRSRARLVEISAMTADFLADVASCMRACWLNVFTGYNMSPGKLSADAFAAKKRLKTSNKPAKVAPENRLLCVRRDSEKRSSQISISSRIKLGNQPRSAAAFCLACLVLTVSLSRFLPFWKAGIDGGVTSIIFI